MSPRQLLERLESLGGIDANLLAKIRREVENPEKTVKPKSVVKFLLKKKQISKSQATDLVNAIDAPAPVVHEEIEVVKKVKEYDTDDLTNTLREEIEEPKKPAPKKPEPVIIADDFDPAAHAKETRVVKPVDLIEVAEPIETSFEVAPQRAAQMPAGFNALPDPFGDPLGDTAQQEDTDSDGENDKPEKGFKGKRLKKDQWSTKWLYIGPAVLGVMLMVGAILYYSLARTSAEDQYDATMAAFDRNAWSDFLDKCKDFLEDNPKHDKFYSLKALRVQALLAQTYEQKNYDETIKRAKEFLPALVEDENVDLNLIRDDLSVTIPNSALEISKRPLQQNDLDGIKAQLAKAEEAFAVADNVTYVTTTARKTPRLATIYAQIEDNILAAKGLIKKEDDFNKSIIEINTLAEASKTDEAFANFQQLTQKYADLAARDDLQALMRMVSTKERGLVHPVEVAVDVATAARPSAVTRSIILASKTGSPVEAHRGIISPVLADGTLFGVDTGDGAVAWRRFMGYQTTIDWQSYDADTIIVCNQADHDVFKIKKLDGSVIWRASVGEPFMSPAISEAMVVVTTASGKVMRLDPQTGAVVAAIQLPQAASVKAMIAEREPYIYQAGDYSNIYVLSADDLTCKDVFYLGHFKGSIQVPPVSWTGVVLVAVNGGDFSDLHVLRNGEEGLDRVQLLSQQTSGPVTTPITRLGRWMLMAADNGHMSVLQNDTTNLVTPITQFVSQSFDNPPGQKVFYHASGTSLWVGGRSLSKYRLKTAEGKLIREKIVEPNDVFIAPMELQDDTLFHVRKRSGSSMVSVSAVDPDSLEEIWRSDIGGAPAGSPRLIGDSLVAISSQGDVFKIDAAAMDRGSVDTPVRSSEVLQSLHFDRTLELGESTGVVFGSGRSDMLYYDARGDGRSTLIQLAAPADELSCPAVAVNPDALVATASGQVLRLDPSTGNRVGEPFQPAVTPSEQVQWFEPAMVDEGTIAIAKNSVANGNKIYLLDISNRESGIREMASLESAVPVRSRLQFAGGLIFTVLAGETGDKLVAIRTGNELVIEKEAEIPDGYVAGPWIVGDNVLVRNRNDQLVAFDSQMQPVWTADLPAGQLAGEPVLRGSQILVAFQSGKIVMVDPAGGSTGEPVELGQPVIHAPVFVGNNMYFSGMDGTVHVVPASGTN